MGQNLSCQSLSDQMVQNTTLFKTIAGNAFDGTITQIEASAQILALLANFEALIQQVNGTLVSQTVLFPDGQNFVSITSNASIPDDGGSPCELVSSFVFQPHPDGKQIVTLTPTISEYNTDGRAFSENPRLVIPVNKTQPAPQYPHPSPCSSPKRKRCKCGKHWLTSID